jgi:L-idonate 5-dehydrogenase
MDAVLVKAREVGADRTINVAEYPEQLAAYSANKGSFDVMFEASGNERALRAGLEVLRPRGILMQLGLGGDISIPQNMIVSKEIDLRGSFRFHEEFALAVDLISRKVVDVKPLLTGIFKLDEAVKAFETAGDRSRSMKVQLAFD